MEPVTYTPLERRAMSYYADSVLVERGESLVDDMRKMLWKQAMSPQYEALLEAFEQRLDKMLVAFALRASNVEDVLDPELDPQSVTFPHPHSDDASYFTTLAELQERREQHFDPAIVATHAHWQKLRLLEGFVAKLALKVEEEKRSLETARALAKQAKQEAARAAQKAKSKKA